MSTDTEPASGPAPMRALAILALTASALLACAGAAFAAPHDAPVVSDAGDRGALTISAGRRGYFVDGLVAEVTRSPVCERSGD